MSLTKPDSTVRRTKRRGMAFFILIALAVVVGGVAWLVDFFDSEKNLKAVWSDGSVITIRGVVAGTNEFTFEPRNNQNISRLLPTFVRRFWRFGGFQSAERPDSPLSLGIYMTRENPTNGLYMDVSQRQVEVVDAAGNVFKEVPAFTSGSGLIGFSLHAFPRREKSFRLRLHGDHNSEVAEFVIPNPFPSTNYPTWTPEAYPITKTNENVKATLLGIPTVDFNRGRTCNPDYQIESEDPTWTTREHINQWFTDATGNKGQYLSPTESAWKFHLQVFRPDNAQFPTNVTWTLPLISVPGDLSISNLQASNTVCGIPIWVPVFCGGGILNISNYFGYSMHGPVSRAGTFGTSWTTQSGYILEEFGSAHPFVVVETGELPESAEIIVRFRDGEGHLVLSKLMPGAMVVPGNPGKREHRYCLVMTRTNVDAAQIEVVVNRPKEFEFLVKPPVP